MFISYDPEHARLTELRHVIEREYLGESIGQLLARGREPLEFARFLFGDALQIPGADQVLSPELGITDAESLAAAIEEVVRWRSFTLRASFPESSGVVLGRTGRELEVVEFRGGHADVMAWRDAVDGDLVQAGFVRTAPWGDAGTKVLPIELPV